MGVGGMLVLYSYLYCMYILCTYIHAIDHSTYPKTPQHTSTLGTVQLATPFTVNAALTNKYTNEFHLTSSLKKINHVPCQGGTCQSLDRSIIGLICLI